MTRFISLCKPTKPFFWVLLSLLCWLVMPSFALDYGLFDSTSDELLDAYGWSSLNLSWIWFGLTLGFLFVGKLVAKLTKHHADETAADHASHGRNLEGGVETPAQAGAPTTGAAASGAAAAPGHGVVVQNSRHGQYVGGRFVKLAISHADRWRSYAELFWVGVIFGFVWFSAQFAEKSFGYAVVGLSVALIGIATNAFARLKFLQGDRFTIASLLSIIVLIGFFIVYPTLAVFVNIFFAGDEFKPSQVITILNSSYIAKVIFNSILLSGFVGFFSTVFGLAFALYTTRIARKTAFIGKLFSILPIVTPPFVVGLGVTLMLGRSGYVTEFLYTYLGFTNTNWLYGFNGIALAQILAFTPLAFMILDGALKSIHPSIEEASYTLRANQYQTFYQIIFPLLRPALANSFLLVFVQSLADFANPLVLGGSFDVLATQIYFYIAGSQLDYASASTLGTVLLVFSLAIFVIQYLWIGNRSYVTVSGKSYRGDVQELPHGLKVAIMVLLGFWVVFNLALYGSIFYGSFTVNWGVDYTLTLKNYADLFGQGFSDGAWPSLINTIVYAGIAAPLTALFGLLIAYIVVRKNFQGKKTLEFLTMLCFAVPGTVAGVSYILAFNTAPLYITGTGIIIIISMVMRDLPIGMRAAIAGLGQLDKSLDEASLSLKGSSFKTIIFITFPLLKHALLSALVTSFVRAMTTFSAIIFLVTADTRVATAYILNRVEDGEYGIAIAYGSILIVVMMAIILWIDWFVGDSRVSRSKAKKQI